MWEKRLAQSIAKKCVCSGIQQSEPVLCFGFELIIISRNWGNLFNRHSHRKTLVMYSIPFGICPPT